MGHTGRAALLGACVTLWACGGEDFMDLDRSDEGQTPAAIDLLVEVWAGGVTQPTLSARVGDRITFMNVDDAPHQMVAHAEVLRRRCAEFDGPLLQSGEAFTVVVRTAGRKCEVRDALSPDDPAFRAVVRVARNPGAVDDDAPVLEELQRLDDLRRNPPIDL